MRIHAAFLWLSMVLTLSPLMAMEKEIVSTTAEDPHGLMAYLTEAENNEFENKQNKLILSIWQNDVTAAGMVLAATTSPKIKKKLLNASYEHVFDPDNYWYCQEIDPESWYPSEDRVQKEICSYYQKEASRYLQSITPLGLALYKQNQKLVTLLLDQGSDINLPFFSEGSALAFAIIHCPQAIRFLIDRGAQKDAVNTFGNTPLSIACESMSSIDAVRSLLAAKVSLCKKSSCVGFGLSPLHIATNNGFYEIVELLLKKGAYVDEPDTHSKATPLHWSVLNGQDHITQLLIENGADVEKKDKYGHTASDKLVVRSQLRAIKYLFSHGAPLPQSTEHKKLVNDAVKEFRSYSSRDDFVFYHKLIMSIIEHDHDNFKNLLGYAQADDLNDRDIWGMTPLHWAVARHNKKAVDAILSLQPEEGLGKITRDIAVLIPWVNAFILHPININDKDYKGRTPLMIAARLGNMTLYRRLVKAGANTMISDNNKKIAFNFAVDGRHFDLMLMMILEDPDVFALFPNWVNRHEKQKIKEESRSHL